MGISPGGFLAGWKSCVFALPDHLRPPRVLCGFWLYGDLPGWVLSGLETRVCFLPGHLRLPVFSLDSGLWDFPRWILSKLEILCVCSAGPVATAT